MRPLEGIAPAVPAYPSSGGDYVMEAKGDTVGTNIFIENYRPIRPAVGAGALSHESHHENHVFHNCN
jgi:hypothetical protein